ncbi:uncharacterized protein LOC144443895 [Glandiceps talaboti]
MESSELPLSIPVKPLLEHLSCPICMSVLTNTYMTPCGHRYCKDCIVECVNRRHKCPCCNRDIVSNNQLIQDHQFDSLIQIIKDENERAEEKYFEQLINSAGNTVGSSSDNRNCSPVEDVLKRHLKNGLAAHENYYREMRQTCNQRVKLLEQDLKNMAEELQRNITNEQELEVKLTELQTNCKQQSDILLGELQRCANLLADAYDRYLGEYIPTPAILPVNITLVLVDKEICFPDIKLKPNDSITTIQEIVISKMEDKDDPVVEFAKDVQYLLVGPFAKRNLYETHQMVRDILQHGAVHDDITILPSNSRPVLQFGAKPGSEILLVGKVKCQSDMPKQCFVTTFEKGIEYTEDYFTCIDCGFNWVCKSCMQVCHKEHQTQPYILKHHPTWACCYCSKKKKCTL